MTADDHEISLAGQGVRQAIWPCRCRTRPPPQTSRKSVHLGEDIGWMQAEHIPSWHYVGETPNIDRSA